MPESEFTINKNGTIDIRSGGIRITGIVPHIQEAPILPFLITHNETGVRFDTESGSISLSVLKDRDELILSTEIEGFENVHDIEPIGTAALSGACSVYVQGYGMEGPSGLHEIDETVRLSHGIIGLSGNCCAAALYTSDHTAFDSSFSVYENKGLYSSETVLIVGINLEGTPGVYSGRQKLPDIHINMGCDVVSCMKRAAERIAAEMKARTQMPPAFHWCSWYYYYENMSQQILEELLAGIENTKTDFRYIQLDAGYTAHIGDWLKFNHRYPEGLGKAAKTILSAGYEAGIWIAPFMVGNESEMYLDHPDWVLREPDGSPYVRFRSYTEPKIWGNTDTDYYVLDMTHPEAFAYLKSVFETYRSWGFTLYKTDFLLWGMIDATKVIRYDNTKTSVMVIRDTLAMIRSVIGEESYLLGSIAPFMPCIGYTDGMRIASDMGAQWTSGAFGPANLLQELPFDNYFNNVFWQNDPDSVILRDFATHLTETESRSIALLQAMSGGVITTSDPIHKLTEDRKRLLEFIKPKDRVKATMPYLGTDHEEIVITHQLHDWNLLYVLNPTSHPLKVDIRMDELFGPEALFQYRFNWNDDGIAAEDGSCFSGILEPHESALLFLTEEPLTVRPSNLWDRTAS